MKHGKSIENQNMPLKGEYVSNSAFSFEYGELPVKKAYTFRQIPNPRVKSGNTVKSISDYETLANDLLLYLYPKFCPEHGLQLTRLISTRQYAIKCPKCRHQQSRFSYTPFHHLKLPLWHVGWLLHESILRFPQVVPSTEISKRLGISNNSALMLKRRLQLFATEHMPRIKELMQAELKEKFQGVELPHVKENRNVNEVLQGRAVPHVDSVVLFSASQRANQGRKRHKHTGQTASIYLSDKIGGKQVGTLVHTLAIKNGPVIFDSISNNRAETLRPLLDQYVPKDVPLFSDSGYDWYNRINKNFRMVNHNRKSDDKRYKWNRNRWSHNGINNQTAEGNHRSLKWQFTAGYGYFRPENSQLYLNEYSFLKCLKYYGWEKIIRTDEEYKKLAEERKANPIRELSKRLSKGKKIRLEGFEIRRTGLDGSEQIQRGRRAKKCLIGDLMGIWIDQTGSETGKTVTNRKTGFRGICFEEAERGRRTSENPRMRVGFLRNKYSHNNWLQLQLENSKFQPLKLAERKRSDLQSGNKFHTSDLENLFASKDFESLREAVQDYDSFQLRQKKHEKESQRFYEFAANQIWDALADDGWRDLDSLIQETGVNRANAYRVIRRWSETGLAEVVDRTHPDGINFKLIYDVRRSAPFLPRIRYVLSRSEFRDYRSTYERTVRRHYVQRKSKSKY